MLVAIIGIRKTRKTRQSGFDVSRRTEARGLATAVDIGAFRTAIELQGRTVVLPKQNARQCSIGFCLQSEGVNAVFALFSFALRASSRDQEIAICSNPRYRASPPRGHA